MKHSQKDGLALKSLMVRHSSSIPDKTKAAVINRSGYTCEDCGAEHDNLEMHHIRYFSEPDHKGGSHPISGKETPVDIELLCRNCHADRHKDLNGDYVRDPEEVRWARDDWYHKTTSNSYN